VSLRIIVYNIIIFYSKNKFIEILSPNLPPAETCCLGGQGAVGGDGVRVSVTSLNVVVINIRPPPH